MRYITTTNTNEFWNRQFQPPPDPTPPQHPAMPMEPPCMFDSIPRGPHDSKVMGLSCPCPRCTPRC